MKSILIKDALLINEDKKYKASVLIQGERIQKIYTTDLPDTIADDVQLIDAEGFLLLPGVIDDQVHFREPGLTHKGDIAGESRAAVAGGVTSYMDMPNTNPQTTTVEALDWKFDRAAEVSMANYSFFIGATNDNIEELKKPEARRATAIKVFMGSSTGNMLVDNSEALDQLFANSGERLIAAHCESESVIAANKAYYIEKYGEDLDVTFHSKIRNDEACYASSAQAVELAKKHKSRLHLFHLSTAKEIALLEAKPLNEKRITGEVCVHHLWFCDEDYARLGNRIKWNPSVKTRADRDALRRALIDGQLDVVATDHAPHLLSEKEGSCLKAASGGPMIQHSLVVMLELCRQGVFTEQLVVEKMCHAPADLFGLKDRGYIREGYYADLVLVDPHSSWTVSAENILYKCGWSPLEGETFSNRIVQTFVNGSPVYDRGRLADHSRGKELEKK